MTDLVAPERRQDELAPSHMELAAAARVARTVPTESASGSRIPGETGVWIFIFGDMTLFLVFFCVLLGERMNSAQLFHRSSRQLHLDLGVVNTLVLLTSSALVAWAMRKVASNEGRAAARLLWGAVVCALTFAAIKAVEYTLLVHHVPAASSNPFFRYYFTLTGIHLAHVLAGTILLTILSVLVRRRPDCTPLRRPFEGGACWWHMVDLIWVILFPLLYLAM